MQPGLHSVKASEPVNQSQPCLCSLTLQLDWSNSTNISQHLIPDPGPWILQDAGYQVMMRTWRVALQLSLPWIHWSSSISKPYNNHSHRSFGEGVNGHKDGAFGPGGIPLLLSVVFNVVPYFVIMVILGSPSPFLIPVLRW